MKMQRSVAPPNVSNFFGFVAETGARCRNTAKISIREKKPVFRIKSSRLWGRHGKPPSNLTDWTTPGRKRVGIRAMLIQVGSQWDSRWKNQREARDCCAHRGLSLPQHLGSSCWIQRAPAGRDEVESPWCRTFDVRLLFTVGTMYFYRCTLCFCMFVYK